MTVVYSKEAVQLHVVTCRLWLCSDCQVLMMR